MYLLQIVLITHLLIEYLVHTTSPPAYPLNKTPPESSVNLTDVHALADGARLSQPDVRPDAVARAKQLLDDPNWLSDENLISLSAKIIRTEDFS